MNIAASDAMNSVGWLGLSLPHQPRRKKGEEGSVSGRFLFPADVAEFRRLFLR
jgi:hypothetical protein